MPIDFTENRKRAPYIGKPRTEYVITSDSRRVERPLDQRLFGRRSAPPDALLWHWTTLMQSWAVDNGFFLERYHKAPLPKIGSARPTGLFETSDNHVKVIPLPKWFDLARVHPAETISDQDVMRTLVKRFKESPHNPLRSTYVEIAIQFIIQQDQYGYSGVWDLNIELYHPNLTWYKRRAAWRTEQSSIHIEEKDTRTDSQKRADRWHQRALDDQLKQEREQVRLRQHKHHDSQSVAAMEQAARLAKIEASWRKPAPPDLPDSPALVEHKRRILESRMAIAAEVLAPKPEPIIDPELETYRDRFWSSVGGS